MMQDMMGGWMRWGMGLPGIAISLVLLLAVAALVKYVFFRCGDQA